MRRGAVVNVLMIGGYGVFKVSQIAKEVKGNKIMSS